MKKAVIILMLMLPVFIYGQSRTTFDVEDIPGADTIYWTRITGSQGVAIHWDFTSLNGNDAQATVYYGSYNGITGGIVPISVEKSTTINKRYPLTLDKTNVNLMNIILDDTTNIFGVEKGSFIYDYIGLGLILNSVTEGEILQTVER